MDNLAQKCGYVAIIGRPNVGKSTLLNHILGQKLSITSRKPQTTRHQLLGIKTIGDVQTIYVDTPGLHQRTTRAMNRYMNRAAASVIRDVDVIVFVTEALKWLPDDEWVLKKLTKVTAPVILVVNKIDQVPNKDLLLPYIKTLTEKMHFAAVIPLSAKQNIYINDLEKIITEMLPPAVHLFPDDQISDRNERFFAAEIIREKLTRGLGQELPYALTVQIEKFALEKGVLHISAVIWVERSGQKRIVIGEKGEKLKEIGTKARLDMEKQFESKVFLQLWVKVKSGWSDNQQLLNQLGYKD